MHAKRSSISLLLQPINNVKSTMTAQSLALQRLSVAVDMSVFQEILDLDTPCELFSKEVVSEFLLMAPELLGSMNESLCRVNLSQLNTSSQSLRCAAMVLGLTRIEKSCARIETVLSLGIDLHYTGFGLGQICEILSYAVRDAHSHFELARMALSSFYSIPLPCDDVSDASIEL
ncbi:hypothetical protein D6D23_03761 [Aureobasidium pullulans]|nr:hypothetical protein D6D23_03761 [Aureobasidium pullulans]